MKQPATQPQGSAPVPADAQPSPTADQVNRANQLNPDHQAFWQSRGKPMPADPKARR